MSKVYSEHNRPVVVVGSGVCPIILASGFKSLASKQANKTLVSAVRRGRRARTEARLENMIFGKNSTRWSTPQLCGCWFIALCAYTQLLAAQRSHRRAARVLQSRSPDCQVFSRARSRTAAFALFRTVGHLSRPDTKEAAERGPDHERTTSAGRAPPSWAASPSRQAYSETRATT